MDLAVAVAIVAVVIAAAGCTATPGSPNGSVKYQEILAFSRCMRAHGVLNFPDPSSNGQVNVNGIDQSSPQVRSAVTACQSLLPGQNPGSQLAQAQLQALKYSRCMRAHGLPHFPDPSVNSSGGGVSITVHQSSSAGSAVIGPRSPQFRAAEQACRPLPRGGSGGAR